MNCKGYVAYLRTCATRTFAIVSVLKRSFHQLCQWCVVHCKHKKVAVQIDKPLLQKIAQLAQLELEAHNEALLLKDLNKIVTWIEKLKELDTTGVNPLVTMALENNVFQEDIRELRIKLAQYGAHQCRDHELVVGIG